MMKRPTTLHPLLRQAALCVLAFLILVELANVFDWSLLLYGTLLTATLIIIAWKG